MADIFLSTFSFYSHRNPYKETLLSLPYFTNEEIAWYDLNNPVEGLGLLRQTGSRLLCSIAIEIHPAPRTALNVELTHYHPNAQSHPRTGQRRILRRHPQAKIVSRIEGRRDEKKNYCRKRMGGEADLVAHSTPAPPWHSHLCPHTDYTVLVHWDVSTLFWFVTSPPMSGLMCNGEIRQGQVLHSGNEVWLHFFFPVKRDFCAARLSIQWDEEKWVSLQPW